MHPYLLILYTWGGECSTSGGDRFWGRDWYFNATTSIETCNWDWGGQLTLLSPQPHYLPTQPEQLELPPRAHPEYLHDHLLLPEEEWCPLPIKGVEGINDSYHLSLYYVVSRCLVMIHLLKVEIHFWSFYMILYHPIRNMFRNFQFSFDLVAKEMMALLPERSNIVFIIVIEWLM